MYNNERYVHAILDSFHAILKTIPHAFCSDVLSVIFSTMDCLIFVRALKNQSSSG